MAVNKLNLFEYRGWSIRMDVRSVGALFAASAELRFDGQCK